MSAVTKYGQRFYEAEANAAHGRCRCSDKGGGCDWCRVYYNGPDFNPCEGCHGTGRPRDGFIGRCGDCRGTGDADACLHAERENGVCNDCGEDSA